jgi:phosphoenolpyruvate synthase/pyruvate phosphate dikinase
MFTKAIVGFDGSERALDALALAESLISRDGELMQIALRRGRRERPELELGVCGEHGGDPASIRFFHDAGLDYVSCSPFRAPIARVAAAQAAIATTRDIQTTVKS